MKKFFRLVTLAISFAALVLVLNIYLYESEKVSALQDHMGFLASKSDINYISSEEEARLKKEEEKAEKKRLKEEEKVAKAEAERIAEEAAAAKKAEEKKLKDEELQKKIDELENRLKNIFSSSKNVNLDVDLINQLPEYQNGCEATSLTMMLKYAGVTVDKTTVVEKMKKDTTPIKYDLSGNIIEWGNPKVGFVGDVTGKNPGSSIDPVALAPIINEYLPGKALDLTGCDYDDLESTLSSGRPVVIWVTQNFTETIQSRKWMRSGEVVTSFSPQHTVLLTGMDEKVLYYNDPLTGEKNASVDKLIFKSIWTKMGNKALSYSK